MLTGETSPSLARLDRAVGEILPNYVEEAVRTVLARHNIEAPPFKTPKVVLSERRIENKQTGRLFSGTTSDEDITLYTPGIEEREALGGDYPLVLLNVFLHECAHFLSGDKKYPERKMAVSGNEVKCQLSVSGFDLRMFVALPSTFSPDLTGGRSYTFFNEGVTESLAREMMDVYLRLHPEYARVTVARIREHRAGLGRNAPFSFYPIAVDFLRCFLRLLARQSGNTAGEWAGIYRDYVAGTNLLASTSWQARFRECGIEMLMERLAGARYIDLIVLRQYLERMLRGERPETSVETSVWSIVQVGLEAARAKT